MAASPLYRLTPSGTQATRGQLGEAVEHAGQGVVESVAVVDPGADHDLAVDLDAVVEQGPQPAQAGRPPTVAQHAGPDLGVGGVDAHPQRGQALGHHPLEVGLGEPGQRGEVAVEKRQPVVVVADVQALAHALGQLVDEAELAVVVAGPDLVEQGGVHLDPERLGPVALDGDRQLEAAPAQVDVELGLVGQQLVLDDVSGDLAVHGDDLVAGHDAGPVGGRPGGHRHHDGQRRPQWTQALFGAAT